MNVNLDRIALEVGRAVLARIMAEQRADEAEARLAALTPAHDNGDGGARAEADTPTTAN